MIILEKIKDNKFLTIFLIIISFIGLSLASVSLLIENSYWWDELYSVTASSLPINDLFREFVFKDVHPPLHLIILHFWINAFGDSEIATRSLSFIFSISSFLIITIWSFKRLDFKNCIPIILFFISSWLFAKYAQETRAYSLMLFLSTISTLLMIEIIRSSTYSRGKVFLFVLSILLLSITHYFGFMYGGLLLIFMLFYLKKINDKIVIFITGLACFIWPIIHLLNGNIASRAENFHVQSDGMHTTISLFVNSIFPHSYVLRKIVEEPWIEVSTAFITIILFIIILNMFFRSIINTLYKDSIKISKLLVYILTSFILTVAFIDLHTPVSTLKNFIVILPLVAILFGYMMYTLKDHIKTYNVLLVIFIMGLPIHSYLQISDKVYPLHNYKKSVQYILDNKLYETRKIYYLGNKDNIRAKIHYDMAFFYFKNKTNYDLKIYPMALDKIYNLDEPFVYFTQHVAVDPDLFIGTFKDRNIIINYYEPKQKVKYSSLVFYTE